MAIKLRAIVGPHNQDDREYDDYYEDIYEEFNINFAQIFSFLI